MADDRDIIEVENFRAVTLREVPIVDEDEEPSPPYQTPAWSGQVHTGGGGCCLSFSAGILVVSIIFLVGVCALFWLIWQFIDSVIPGICFSSFRCLQSCEFAPAVSTGTDFAFLEARVLPSDVERRRISTMIDQTMATTRMPMTHADYDDLKGRDVYCLDGAKVGVIKNLFHPNMEMPEARGKHHFLLEPGLLKHWFGGRENTYLSETTVTSVTSDGVFLSLTEDEIRNHSWDEPGSFSQNRES